jgi:hypothetical protein
MNEMNYLYWQLPSIALLMRRSLEGSLSAVESDVYGSAALTSEQADFWCGLRSGDLGRGKISEKAVSELLKNSFLFSVAIGSPAFY